jgi:Zn-dependent protease
MNSIYTLTTWIIPLLLCIILHEVAHGYVAYKLGDKTAWLMGRLNLNPARHFDPIGSALVPGMLWLTGSPVLFGWAKPVPVDFRQLKNPKRDMGLVALAGPLSNVLLAIVFVLFAKLVLFVLPNDSFLTMWIMENVKNGIAFSLFLACFNLLPILPLDGGRVLSAVLPPKLSYKYQESEKYGLFILIGVLFILPMMGIDIVRIFVNVLYPFFARIVSFFM